MTNKDKTNMSNAGELKFRYHGDNEWKKLDTLTPAKDGQDNKPKFNEVLLQSLKMPNLIVLAGSGTSCEAYGPSMAYLWEEINPTDVMSEVRYDEKINGKNIEKLLSHCEAYLQVNPDKKIIEEFVEQAKNIILGKCRDFLDKDRKEQILSAHEIFLRKLSRRRLHDPRMKLFTTNYDLCFEKAACFRGIIVNDGFSLTPPRFFDPRFFDYDIVRRTSGNSDSSNYVEGVFHLLKLHGSVNWERGDSSRVIFQSKEPKADKACLIYPVDGKYQQSYTQPYLELFARFTAALREPNTCLLVIGCGFNDSHLAEPIVAAVKTNSKFRLIIVNRNAKKKISDSEGDEKNYWHQFNELSRAGEDISFVNASFNTFTENIPDLQSLTPAQQLEKAIYGIKEGRSE